MTEPYVYDPNGNVIPLSDYQARYGPQYNQSAPVAEPEPVQMIPESATIKVFRRTPRQYEGFYCSFPAVKVNQVETEVQTEFGGGLFEFQIWNAGQKLNVWKTKLLGPPMDNARELIPQADLDAEQLAEKPMWQNGSPGGPPTRPGQANTNGLHMRADGSAMFESFSMSGDEWWRTQYAELQGKLARSERRIQELEETARRERDEKGELKAEIARLKERHEAQKHFQELANELSTAKSGSSNDLMALLLPKLLDNSLAKGKTESLSDQLDTLEKLKKLAGGDQAPGGNSDGIEFVKALSDMVAKVAPVMMGAPGPAPAAAQQQQPSPAVSAPYATADFKKVLEEGLQNTPQDFAAWAARAAPTLTQAGADALLAIGDDAASMGQGIATWATHLPGVDVHTFVKVLRENPPLMGWAMGAVNALKGNLRNA